ncbi:hypothetical protein [Maledivibacter halophilus]|nr:hypothetical protein [Maledivibacter halophilus]
MNADNNDQCLEYKPTKRYNDNTLKEIIHKEYEIDNINKMSIKEIK